MEGKLEKKVEYVSETKELIEVNAKGMPVKDIHWHANQLQAEPVRVLDPGVGQAHVLRHFMFQSLPLPPGVKRPSKLEIINHYKKLIEMTLWGDGLVIREDKPIEVHTLEKAKNISKSLYLEMRKNKADFCILVLAVPKRGITVREEPLRAL